MGEPGGIGLPGRGIRRPTASSFQTLCMADSPASTESRWAMSAPGCNVTPLCRCALWWEDTMHRWQQTTLVLGLTLTATPTVAQDKFEIPLSSLATTD